MVNISLWCQYYLSLMRLEIAILVNCDLLSAICSLENWELHKKDTPITNWVLLIHFDPMHFNFFLFRCKGRISLLSISKESAAGTIDFSQKWRVQGLFYDCWDKQPSGIVKWKIGSRISQIKRTLMYSIQRVLLVLIANRQWITQMRCWLKIEMRWKF